MGVWGGFVRLPTHLLIHIHEGVGGLSMAATLYQSETAPSQVRLFLGGGGG